MYRLLMVIFTLSQPGCSSSFALFQIFQRLYFKIIKERFHPTCSLKEARNQYCIDNFGCGICIVRIGLSYFLFSDCHIEFIAQALLFSIIELAQSSD